MRLLFTPVHLLTDSSVEGQYVTYFFFKIPHVEFFFMSVRPPHILQIMLKDNNTRKKIQKEITWITAKYKILIRRRTSHYVTLARLIIIQIHFIIFFRGCLLWHACIKVQYGCIFHPPKHNRAFCNSLKKIPCENSNTYFNENKKSYCWYLLDVRICIWECIPIWLLTTGKNAESHISSVSWFAKSLYLRVLIISLFSFEIALLPEF